ncbi:hypothetical protein PQO03_17755 [Lentisphaera profundi]|uniref:General secretion pathway protein GspM n=1 Tax=Lentisphaera profundi TaxID=1658616 RepID=A0ABY7VWM7_9BACT|nr:hypothetical protein [Lentisphaera profundi]WDE97673.1 hypothetical protein PQO03_17755 [Lentisphaera profundi]
MNKRQKYLLLIMLLMIAVVIIDNSKLSFNMDFFNGNDAIRAKQNHQKLSTDLQLALHKESELESLEKSNAESLKKLYSYEGPTSPRSLIQQEIRKYLQVENLDQIIVNVGREKSLTTYEHLKVIDYPLTGTIAAAEMKSFYSFLRALADNEKIYNWSSFQLTASKATSKAPANNFRLNGVLRTYVKAPLIVQGAQ